MPASLVVGFGEACRIATEQWQKDARRMSELTFHLRKGIQNACSDVRFFGHLQKRLPGNLNLGFPGVTADEAINIVSDRIAVSTGSACASGTAEASKVLLALGLKPEIAATGIRVSLGRFSCEPEIETALEAFSTIASTLKSK